LGLSTFKIPKNILHQIPANATDPATPHAGMELASARYVALYDLLADPDGVNVDCKKPLFPSPHA
jgi:hypothetical protein